MGQAHEEMHYRRCDARPRRVRLSIVVEVLDGEGGKGREHTTHRL